MNDLRAETVIAMRKNVIGKKVASEFMLLHLESGDYFGLNETGSEFWRLVDGRRTVKEIASLAAQTFDVSTETTQKDVLDFFKRLYKYELIDLL